MDEHEDVRRMLAGAVRAEEKQQRDIVGSAVGIVRRRRRRVRTYGATASGLAVAMGATAMVWAGGGAPVTAHPGPAGSSTTAATSVTSSTSASTAPAPWDKEHDIFYRLPGLLDPLLPKGLSVTKNGATLPNADFWLAGPSGNNDFALTVTPKEQRNRAMEDLCVAGGVCSHHEVPGGTLYIQTKNFTSDYAGNSGYAPGTGKQVLSFSDEYEFVPSASDGMVIDVVLNGVVSHEHYAAEPPSGWEGQWPPPRDTSESFNASGDLLSADAFQALIAKPGFSAVTALLNPSTPVDQSTVARHKAADAAIAAAVKPILPSGLTLAIGTTAENMPNSNLILTGPSGTNLFSWTTQPQDKNWHHGQACAAGAQPNCTSKDVPGGEIEITHTVNDLGKSGAADAFAPGTAATPTSGGDVYKFLPDDPNGTIIELATGEQYRDIPWAATRPTTGPYSDPHQTWPPPARNGEPFNPGGSLLTADQFATLVQAPGIADIVRTVNAAVDPVGNSSVFQTWN